MGDIIQIDFKKQNNTENEPTMEELVEHVKTAQNIVKHENNGMKTRVWPALDGSYKVFVTDSENNGSFNTFTNLESAMAAYEKIKEHIDKGEADWRVLNAILVNMHHA